MLFQLQAGKACILQSTAPGTRLALLTETGQAKMHTRRIVLWNFSGAFSQFQHVASCRYSTVGPSNRGLMQVVKVLTVEDTESTKLLRTTIDIGNGQTRQVGRRLLLVPVQPQ